MSFLARHADLIFTVVGLGFVWNLLPTLLNKGSAVPRVTSVFYAFGTALFAFTDWSIHLPMSAIETLLTALVWGLIAWRRPVR